MQLCCYELYPEAELVLCTMLLFSLRNPACDRQFSAYRATVAVRPGSWATVRLPWDAFRGYGPGPDVTPFVPILRRLGIVSIGEAKEEVVLAVARVGFYNVV